MQQVKTNLAKAIRLEQYFKAAEQSQENIEDLRIKFTSVWGETLANYFLSKYDNATSLIWALDSDNLELFIERF